MHYTEKLTACSNTSCYLCLGRQSPQAGGPWLTQACPIMADVDCCSYRVLHCYYDNILYSTFLKFVLFPALIIEELLSAAGGCGGVECDRKELGFDSERSSAG